VGLDFKMSNSKNSEIRIIVLERNKELAVVNGYKHRYFGVRQWRN